MKKPRKNPYGRYVMWLPEPAEFKDMRTGAQKVYLPGWVDVRSFPQLKPFCVRIPK